MKQAFRADILDEIDQFRKDNPRPDRCPLCKTRTDNYHVDHVVKFRDILDGFLKTAGAKGAKGEPVVPLNLATVKISIK